MSNAVVYYPKSLKEIIKIHKRDRKAQFPNNDIRAHHSNSPYISFKKMSVFTRCTQTSQGILVGCGNPLRIFTETLADRLPSFIVQALSTLLPDKYLHEISLYHICQNISQYEHICAILEILHCTVLVISADKQRTIPISSLRKLKEQHEDEIYSFVIHVPLYHNNASEIFHVFSYDPRGIPSLFTAGYIARNEVGKITTIECGMYQHAKKPHWILEKTHPPLHFSVPLPEADAKKYISTSFAKNYTIYSLEEAHRNMYYYSLYYMLRQLYI